MAWQTVRSNKPSEVHRTSARTAASPKWPLRRRSIAPPLHHGVGQESGCTDELVSAAAGR